MATERVKVFEERERKGLPIWAWLLPLLLLLGLLAWYLLHRHTNDAAVAPAVPVATAPATTTGNVAAMPDLGSVHFDTDKATLTAEGTATLTQAAQYMKQNPKVRLRLEGYTDATGTDPHNQTLSQLRAMTAGQFLLSQGIDRSRLTGEGFVPENPIAPNDTSAGKADNRRVELFQQQ